MLGILVMLAAALAAYAVAWALAGLIGLVVVVPRWLRPALPWLIFQLYLVVGLFWAGDLPGAPRTVLRLLLFSAGVSLLLGSLSGWWRSRRTAGVRTAGVSATARRPVPPPKQWLKPALLAWLLAGTLPWGLALLAEAL